MIAIPAALILAGFFCLVELVAGGASLWGAGAALAFMGAGRCV
jgi:hypothetical protein